MHNTRIFATQKQRGVSGHELKCLAVFTEGLKQLCDTIGDCSFILLALDTIVYMPRLQ